MRKYIKILLGTVLVFGSCQSIVEDLNVDPNKVTNIDGKALLKGAMLADAASQAGFLNWAGGVASGYFEGDGRLDPIQNYTYVDTDSNTPWANIYQGTVKQCRLIRSGIQVSNKDFMYGVSKIIEAHALGTAANIFGDIPYTEAANDDIPKPKYDDQVAVYASLQTLLDEAITNLQNSGVNSGIPEDIYFGGSSSKWIKVAYTLKARLYLDVKNYSSAMSAAQMGISSANESMKYQPLSNTSGTKNLLNELINSSTFGGDVTVANSYLIKLIGTGAGNRNNSKTNETDRFAYYYNGTSINDNGIAGALTPMNQVTYQENLLIWAEAALRANSSTNFNTALSKLNEHRANLRNGVYFTSSSGQYDDYVEADFIGGGIENVDSSLTKENALLREIIEERYITFFAEILGFNDLRRINNDDVSLRVQVPYNTGSQYPQRFLYPFTETNANKENVPNITDIFVKTAINQ